MHFNTMPMRGVLLMLLLLPATVATERDYCVQPNTFFDTQVVVNFDGNPDLLCPRDYIDLEKSFQEAYNSVRRDFCDDLSRKVVAVSVNDTSIEETTATEFSLRFAVNVGCDRCGPDTDFFFVPKLRRELSTNNGLLEQTEAILDGLENGNHDPTHSRSLHLRGKTKCCPPNGESRGPTGDEFALEFDHVYKKKMVATREDQGVPIEQVITAFEVFPIDCPEEEDFETIVFVELSTRDDPDSVLEAEIAALENSFRTSFNSFSQEGKLCDPFFRTVTSVTIENEEGRRRLASSSTRYKYKVKGRCRGCAKENKRLFGEGSGRRQLVSSAPRWLYDRELRFMMSDDTCFCAVGTEERAVEEDEFTVVYNDDVVRLQNEGVLVNIDGVLATEEYIPPTIIPTTSPTSYPTARPTTSPTPYPTARPTTSPTRYPTARPTTSPTNYPTAPPTISPTSYPTALADPRVVSFTLINATDNTEKSVIQNGGTIYIKRGTQINIRADTSPAYPVGSVWFALNDNPNFRTENVSPFALAGDKEGDYLVWKFKYGPQFLKATPYALPDASGTVGTSTEIAFTLTDVPEMADS
jgi:hypothetical protein